MLLSRKHTRELLALLDFLEEKRRPSSSSSMGKRHFESSIFELFSGTNASDELFFPTVLAMLGHSLRALEEAPSEPDKDVIRRRVTYCDWTDCVKGPKSFLPFDDKARAALEQAKKERTVFFRKIQFLPLISRNVSIEDKKVLLDQWLSECFDEESARRLRSLAYELLSAPEKSADDSDDSIPRKKLKVSDSP